MRSLEELVAPIAECSVSKGFAITKPGHSPERAERCHGEPGLKDQRYYASPVEQRAASRHLFHHVVVPDVIHNERKRMHQCEHEEGVRDPSVKDLQFLMSDPCQQRDPVRLACSCAGKC